MATFDRRPDAPAGAIRFSTPYGDHELADGANTLTVDGDSGPLIYDLSLHPFLVRTDVKDAPDVAAEVEAHYRRQAQAVADAQAAQESAPAGAAQAVTASESVVDATGLQTGPTPVPVEVSA